MATLELAGLGLDIGGQKILDDVNLTAKDGEFLVLVGASGSGKSTILRVIAGLMAPTRGNVSLDGVRIDAVEPARRDVAMVFQNYALYPHMTVEENIAFPLRMAGVAKDERRRRARTIAATLGLERLLDRKPSQLSGGQQQRTALGRAIIRAPRVFLFDEPLSNLDAQTRAEMRSELAAMHHRLGITTIYVTHDQVEAMTLGGRLAVLDKGRVRQIGAPLEVHDRPIDTTVARFIGSPPINLVEGRAGAGVFVAGALTLDCPRLLDGPVILGIRPHHVGMTPGGPCRVAAVEAYGSRTEVWVSVPDSQNVLAEHPGRPEFAKGAAVRVSIPSGACIWFRPDDGKLIDVT